MEMQRFIRNRKYYDSMSPLV